MRRIAPPEKGAATEQSVRVPWSPAKIGRRVKEPGPSRFGRRNFEHSRVLVHCMAAHAFGSATGNANVDRPLQRSREFRNSPNPKVADTVEVPSLAGAGEGGRRRGEGCGAENFPALEFIVFLRPVKSRILWEQMLGRGTRLCPDINKSRFAVFDCFDGTLSQYFRNVSRA